MRMSILMRRLTLTMRKKINKNLNMIMMWMYRHSAHNTYFLFLDKAVHPTSMEKMYRGSLTNWEDLTIGWAHSVKVRKIPLYCETLVGKYIRTLATSQPTHCMEEQRKMHRQLTTERLPWTSRKNPITWLGGEL